MASSRRSASPADPATGDPDFASVPATIDRTLRALLPEVRRGQGRGAAGPALVVAFSGGMDSTVLLDAVAALLGPDRCLAIHVHHGLQPAADAWPAHCEAQARALGVRFESVRLPPAPGRGRNLEAWAREARYAALANCAREAGALAILTAHHADDQAETLTMRIARGTGPDGLRGILQETAFDGVRVLRPMLELTRAALAACAAQRGLRWIEDPTNADTMRLRNAIRHIVMPAIDKVAPGFRANLLRLSEHLEDGRAAVDALARIDLDAARIAAGPACGAESGAPSLSSRPRTSRSARAAKAAAPAASGAAARSSKASPAGVPAGVPADALRSAALSSLEPFRRRAALRRWIAELGAPMPGARRLEEIDRQLLAPGSARGCVEHDGLRLVRDRGWVFAEGVPGAVRSARAEIDPGSAREDCGGADSDSTKGLRTSAGSGPERRTRVAAAFFDIRRQTPGELTLRWSGESAIALPDHRGTLHFDPSSTPDAVSAAWLRGATLAVRPGSSSVRIRTAPQGPRRTLKNLYQEADVPAIARAGLPLVCVDGMVLYASGIGMDRDPRWPRQGPGVVLRWMPAAR